MPKNLFETKYIETPLKQYWGGNESRVLSPWIFILVIAGLTAGLVFLR